MNEVKVHGVYRHYKGDLYIVEDIALDCETLEQLVIYRALYENGQVWVRKLSDFVSEVNTNGQQYRFELQEIKSKR